MSTDRGSAARQAAVRKAAARVRDTEAAAEAVVTETPPSVERNLAAKAAHEAAKAEYARALRENAEFIARSEAAEKQLEDGPPWDDEFSPRELLEEHYRSQA